MDLLEMEMQHMLLMLEPPFFDGWKDEIERKARDLEANDPAYAGLWSRLKNEVQKRGWHRASAKKESASSSEQPREQPGLEIPPAHMKQARKKLSTGSRSTSLLEG